MKLKIAELTNYSRSKQRKRVQLQPYKKIILAAIQKTKSLKIKHSMPATCVKKLSDRKANGRKPKKPSEKPKGAL